MLAMADRQGRVWASIPGLANRARVPLGDTEKALETFLAPDRYSRTPDHDGRRIEPIDGGWRLLNHSKYRDMRDDEIRREQNRDAKQRQRSRSAEMLTISQSQPESAQAEADTEAYTEAGSKEKDKPPVAPLALPAWLNVETWNSYVKTRPARARKPESLKAALQKLEKFRADGFDPNEIVANSLANGWQMLKEPDAKRGVTPDYSSLVKQ